MSKNFQQARMSSEAYLDTTNKHFNLWWQATFFMAVLFVVTLLLWGLDSRQLDIFCYRVLVVVPLITILKPLLR